jgi:transposase
MNRHELERLSKDELIDLVLRIQRPGKTSATSSKPPSSDDKANLAASKPGGAKPGHKGRFREAAEAADITVDYRPEFCPHCAAALDPGLAARELRVYETVDLPVVKPVVTFHRRLQLRCPHCQGLAKGPLPEAAKRSLFGPRLAGIAVYLKAFQHFSYERLRFFMAEVFGLKISEGGLMNLMKRGTKAFAPGAEAALTSLRRAETIASDETGVRIEGRNGHHWVFASEQAVVHRTAMSRGSHVVREVLDGHKPEFWLSDRYSAQQGHGRSQQTCLAHLARHIAYGLEASEDMAPLRLKLWLGKVFALAETAADLAPKSLARRRRDLDNGLASILKTGSACPVARALLAKIANARDQVFTFCEAPGAIAVTNNQCERLLRPAVIQRKVTNGYRSAWAASMEAMARTATGTAALAGTPRLETILAAFR